MIMTRYFGCNVLDPMPLILFFFCIQEASDERIYIFTSVLFGMMSQVSCSKVLAKAIKEPDSSV